MIVALIALGYTLVYGILQLINFANGDVFMLGSMLTFFGVQIVGLTSDSPPLSVILTFAVLLPVTMLLTAGLNASIERVAYRPLRQRADAGDPHLGHRHVVHPPERRARTSSARRRRLTAEPAADQQRSSARRPARDRDLEIKVSHLFVTARHDRRSCSA